MRYALRNSLAIGALVAIVVPHAFAQTLTGQLRTDIDPPTFRAGFQPTTDTLDTRHRKSVPIAIGLSGLVPGLGQVYAGTPWWRPVAYAAIEAAGWIGFAVWTSGGNKATEDFERFADAHWDVIRYVNWIRANYQLWSPDDVDHAVAEDALTHLPLAADPSLPSWRQVDFVQLNRLERAVHGGFSHTLPAHGDQQYYEEIGKYIQYRAGWDDHGAANDTLIFDPSHVTARNEDYTRQRQHANDLLSYADYAIAAIVLNHLVSMLDAGLTAHKVNMALAPTRQVRPDGSFEPGLGLILRIEF